METLNSHFF